MEWDSAKEMVYGSIMEVLWERMKNGERLTEKPVRTFSGCQ